MGGVLAHTELGRHAAHRGLRPQPVVAVSLHRRRGEDLQRAPCRRPDTPPNLAGRRADSHRPREPMTDQLSRPSARRTTRPVEISSANAQRGTRRHEPTRSTGSPARPFERLVLAGELVGQRPTDPQHGGRFVDRQQHRVLIERTQHHLDDAHMPTYSHVVRRRNPRPPPPQRRGGNCGQPETTADNDGQPRTIQHDCCFTKSKGAHLDGSAKRHMASALQRRSSRTLMCPEYAPRDDQSCARAVIGRRRGSGQGPSTGIRRATRHAGRRDRVTLRAR